MYKFIFYGEIDGDNVNLIQLRLRYGDTSGEITNSQGHWTQLYQMDGTSLQDTRNTYSVLLQRPISNDIFRYSGSFDITIGQTVNNINHTGQISVSNRDASTRDSQTINGGLTTNAGLTTRITKFYIRSQGGAIGSTSYIFGQVFRML